MRDEIVGSKGRRGCCLRLAVVALASQSRPGCYQVMGMIVAEAASEGVRYLDVEGME